MMKKSADMTKGGVASSIVLFALPILFGNLFQQAYNLADTAIAGRYLGDDALSAIGAGSSLFAFLMYFIGGLNGGFSLVAARFFGEKNKDKLKNAIATMVVMNVCISIIAMIVAVVALKPLLHLINTPQEIINESFKYLVVVFLGAGVMSCYNAQASLLRAMGNSFTPIVFLVISSIINIGLDVLFISTFHMGVRGAAFATVISQLVSCVLCQITIVRSYKEYKTEKENYKYDRALYKEMFSAGITMAMMNCIFAVGSLVLQGAINNLGKTVIAGHLASRRIAELFMQPMNTIAAACSTFVSQNYGAKQYDRIKKAIVSSIAMTMSMALVFIALVYGLCDQMISVVTSSANQVIFDTARQYLHINLPFYIVLGVLYVLRTSIQSIGRRLPPLCSSGIEMLTKFVAAFVLTKQFGYLGVCVAEPISWVLGVVLMIFAFTSAYKALNKKQFNNLT